VPKTYKYEGQSYEVFSVPTETGDKEMALVKKGRKSSFFVDPQNPEAGLIEWEGFWNKLERVNEFAPQWKNYKNAYEMIKFFRLLGNTMMYAFVS
jgi:multiple sugar transport system permease protein